MTAVVWRILIAVIAVLFVWAMLPLFLQVVGVTISAVALQLIRLCIAALAVFYVLSGPNQGTWKP